MADSLPIPTATLVEEGGELYWIDDEAYQRVSALEAYSRLWGFLTAVAVAIAVVVGQPLLGIVRLFRKAPRDKFDRIRQTTNTAMLVTSIGLLITLGLFFRYGLFGNTADLKLIGNVSWISVTLAISSFVTVSGALVALFSAALHVAQCKRLSAWLTLLATLPLAGIACLWISNGWAPLMTWQ